MLVRLLPAAKGLSMPFVKWIGHCVSSVFGVKTNIPFLIKLMHHPTFVDGLCTTRFIDQTPELLVFKPRKDRAANYSHIWQKSSLMKTPW
ncbi:MAG: hypothetical protein R3C11_19235 [Planctomycetaceae bacterium]